MGGGVNDTTIQSATPGDARKTGYSLERLAFIREVEDLFYLEASLLDDRKWDEWLSLFTEDVHYWMPIRRNMSFKDRDRDVTDADEISWFDDDKPTLVRRVRQLMTGVHWAEEPLSRVSHMVSNVRVVSPVEGLEEGALAEVSTNFIVHRSRLQTETDFFVGRREDVLRRVDGDLRICRRNIIIDQAVLLAKNLTIFL